jgi:hypothetical protein
MTPTQEHINMPYAIPVVHEWYVENSIAGFTDLAAFTAFVAAALPPATAGKVVGNVFSV